MLTGFDLCRAAVAAPGVTGTERNVLMVLAIMADNKKAQCYPPISGPTGLTTKCARSSAPSSGWWSSSTSAASRFATA